MCIRDRGKIVEVLGDNMGTGMAVDMALRTHEIPYVWPPAGEKQVSGLKAVSYTHLDVYKRQAQAAPAPHQPRAQPGVALWTNAALTRSVTTTSVRGNNDA